MEKQFLVKNIEENYKLIAEVIKHSKKIKNINNKIYRKMKYGFFIVSILIIRFSIATFKHDVDSAFSSGKTSNIDLLFRKFWTSLGKANDNYKLFLLMMISALIIFLLMRIKHSYRKKRLFKKFKPTLEESYGIINENLSKCRADCVLPVKYQNEHSMRIIIEYFNNLRADTLKEAINLYEDERLKKAQIRKLDKMASLQNKMIQKQSEMISAQRSTNFLLSVNSYSNNL